MRVTPLKGKRPFLEQWNKTATTDEEQIRKWAEQYPDSNVGCAASNDTWMLDVDDVGWFMENCPPDAPKTLTVQTGSGKLHLYFKHDDDSRKLQMRAVMNPKWRRQTETDPGTPDEPQKYMEFPDQTVGPGSIHPDTGRPYKILRDEPVAAAPKSWLEWLKALSQSRINPRALKVNPLRHDWNPEERLKEAGLKFRKSERDGKVYFNYHADHGKCLIRGASHAEKGETPNPRQTAFVWDPKTNEFWHQCFSGGCQIPGKTRVALEALGIKLEEVVRPWWRDLFEAYEDFVNAPELKWVVKNMATDESMNMVGGPSGQGKTWIMLCVVKALLEGSKLFGNFEAEMPPEGVLYLIPEVGRRSFMKRLRLLRMDHLLKDDRLLVRTLSMGQVIPLTDKRILRAAKGRDVFLDTAVRFMEGSENDSTDNNLAESGFALLGAGARSWWGVHHSPKSFAKATSMSLEEVLRGSGDIGAMLSSCYGVRQLDPERNLVHVECVKARDLDEVPRPYQVEFRPWVDKEGRPHMVKSPGECGFLDEELSRSTGAKGGPFGAKGGRPRDEEKVRQMMDDKAAGMSIPEIAKKHGVTTNAVYKALRRSGDPATDQTEF